MQARQKEVEAALAAKKRPTRIKTSEERRAEAQRAKERREAVRAAKIASGKAPKPPTSPSRIIEAALRRGKITESQLDLLRRFDMSDAQIAEKLDTMES